MINIPDHDNIMKWIETLKRPKKLYKYIVIILIIVILVLVIVFQNQNNSILRNEVSELRQELIQEQNKNIQLVQQLQPFEKLAETLYPEFAITKAVSKLTEDFNKLQMTVAKYEFTSLKNEIKEELISKLKELKVLYEQKSLSIEITYETWVLPSTRKFAEQLVNLLSDAGLKVIGPNFATVYLVGPSFPLEWGYNQDDQELAELLYQSLQTIIIPNNKYSRRTTLQKGKIRIHFAGQVIFDPSGVVSVK